MACSLRDQEGHGGAAAKGGEAVRGWIRRGVVVVLGIVALMAAYGAAMATMGLWQMF
jgi:hypothetical protein